MPLCGIHQLRCTAECHDLPVCDVHHALGARGEIGIMSDHDDSRSAAMYILEQFHYSAGHLRVEIASRLVGQQEPWFANQRTCNGDSLLLTSRHLGGIMVRPGGEPHPLEDGIDAPAALGA